MHPKTQTLLEVHIFIKERNKSKKNFLIPGQKTSGNQNGWPKVRDTHKSIVRSKGRSQRKIQIGLYANALGEYRKNL